MKLPIKNIFPIKTLLILFFILGILLTYTKGALANGEQYSYGPNGTIIGKGGEFINPVTFTLTQTPSGPAYVAINVGIKINSSTSCMLSGVLITVDNNNKNAASLVGKTTTGIGQAGSLPDCSQSNLQASGFTNQNISISGSPSSTTPAENSAQQLVSINICSSKGTNAPQTLYPMITGKGILGFKTTASRFIETNLVGNPAFYVQPGDNPGTAIGATDHSVETHLSPGTYTICAQLIGCKTFTKVKYQRLDLNYSDGNCFNTDYWDSIQVKINVNYITTANKACTIGPYTVVLNQNNKEIARKTTQKIHTIPPDPNSALFNLDNATAYPTAEFDKLKPNQTFQVCLPDFQNQCKTVKTLDAGRGGAVSFDEHLNNDQMCSTNTAPSLPPPPSPPCVSWNNGQCKTFNTTFGAFPTDPAGFITRIFAVLLSVSGGIAALLIIRAGYQLMTSQGKPEQLQNGRDQLIAAIVGLVFLIFSFALLQIIGFNILHIPGFK